MKTSLKANLLKHFITKKEEGGFTLIELLVVIIIIGILAAIALPSFLNQANKAKQSEAKTYIGSMNRAQQAYFLERNTFAINENFAQLGLGVNPTTANYQYSISTARPTGGIRQYALPIEAAQSALKTYGGAVTIGTTGGGTPANTEATTLAVMCEGALSPLQGGAYTLEHVNTAVIIPGSGANVPACNEVQTGTGMIAVR
ncbi:type IV pilin-like G/H family protein [Nodosilinea sp. E11]|uniref:type IV pilin-like G/H family protein n=1 Tax=Nodosilinea sp. E11 TaxID=3037479 RepID=UPI002934831C|nr:type IV pilin-like G/H family protein [Nodosilinea sp. E11]WOD39031.1 type IV pilin-like G/H family protein [Nodosilinea sp. E11]